MPDPQSIRLLLVPSDARFGSENLKREPVLAAGGHLAHRKCASRSFTEAKHDDAEVFRIDGKRFVFGRRGLLSRKGLDRTLRALPRFVESCQIGAYSADGKTGKVLNHVHPVRTDISHYAQLSIKFRVEPPVPVGVV